MKWILAAIACVVLMAVGLSIYLQPNDFSLCPYNNGEPDTREGCGSAQAIVVVSGGDTPARTKKAVDYYHKGWSKKLIFSGAAADKTGLSNAAAMRLDAISQGVPAGDILIEEYAEDTHENAVKTVEILNKHNIKDIILITSGYHQRRAFLEFAAAARGHNIEIRNLPTYDRDWGWWWWITPRGWWLALGEFGKIMVFHTGGTNG